MFVLKATETPMPPYALRLGLDYYMMPSVLSGQPKTLMYRVMLNTG
jgi:hypothetical protein